MNVLTILTIIAATHLGIMIIAFIALLVYMVRPNPTTYPSRYEKLYLNDHVSGGGRVMGGPKV